MGKLCLLQMLIKAIGCVILFKLATWVKINNRLKKNIDEKNIFANEEF